MWVRTSFFQTNTQNTIYQRGFQSLTAVNLSTLYNLLKTLGKADNRRARSDEGQQGLLRISLLTCCGPVRPSAGTGVVQAGSWYPQLNGPLQDGHRRGSCKWKAKEEFWIQKGTEFLQHWSGTTCQITVLSFCLLLANLGVFLNRRF